MCIRRGKVKKQLISFLTFYGFSQFSFHFAYSISLSFLSLISLWTDWFICSFIHSSINIFEYQYVTGSLVGIKITKNQNQKPIRGYLPSSHAQRHTEVMFNVHVGILNHWEASLSRINNPLTEKTKLCIMLKGIRCEVPSSFGDRAFVEPCISLMHFFVFTAHHL